MKKIEISIDTLRYIHSLGDNSVEPALHNYAALNLFAKQTERPAIFYSQVLNDFRVEMVKNERVSISPK